MSGEQVISAALLVVLRLGADVENLSSQGNVSGRGLISPVEFLHKTQQKRDIYSSTCMFGKEMTGGGDEEKPDEEARNKQMRTNECVV